MHIAAANLTVPRSGDLEQRHRLLRLLKDVSVQQDSLG